MEKGWAGVSCEAKTNWGRSAPCPTMPTGRGLESGKCELGAVHWQQGPLTVVVCRNSWWMTVRWAPQSVKSHCGEKMAVLPWVRCLQRALLAEDGVCCVCVFEHPLLTLH